MRVAGYDVVRDAPRVRERIGRLCGLGHREATCRADRIVDRIDLADAADRQVRTYSGGMRRRMDLAASLIARPEVLSWTNPPPASTRPAARSCASWSASSRPTAPPCCSPPSTWRRRTTGRRIAVIDHGRLLVEGTTADLKARFGTAVVALTFVPPHTDAAVEILRPLEARAPDPVWPEKFTVASRVPVADQSDPVCTPVLAVAL